MTFLYRPLLCNGFSELLLLRARFQGMGDSSSWLPNHPRGFSLVRGGDFASPAALGRVDTIASTLDGPLLSCSASASSLPGPPGRDRPVPLSSPRPRGAARAVRHPCLFGCVTLVASSAVGTARNTRCAAEPTARLPPLSGGNGTPWDGTPGSGGGWPGVSGGWPGVRAKWKPLVSSPSWGWRREGTVPGGRESLCPRPRRHSLPGPTAPSAPRARRHSPRKTVSGDWSVASSQSAGALLGRIRAGLEGKGGKMVLESTMVW